MGAFTEPVVVKGRHILSLLCQVSRAVCTNPRLLLEYELRQVRVAAMPIVYRQHTASFINILPVIRKGICK